MKFRGKRIDNGEWVEGDIHWGKYYRTVHIHPALGSNFSYNIYPDSVSMSTGQKDKNGVEIFGSIPINKKISKGGDIVKHIFETHNPAGVTIPKQYRNTILEIQYNDACCGFNPFHYLPEWQIKEDTFEVIGKQYKGD